MSFETQIVIGESLKYICSFNEKALSGTETYGPVFCCVYHVVHQTSTNSVFQSMREPQSVLYAPISSKHYVEVNTLVCLVIYYQLWVIPAPILGKDFSYPKELLKYHASTQFRFLQSESKITRTVIIPIVDHYNRNFLNNFRRCSRIWTTWTIIIKYLNSAIHYWMVDSEVEKSP